MQMHLQPSGRKGVVRRVKSSVAVNFNVTGWKQKAKKRQVYNSLTLAMLQSPSYKLQILHLCVWIRSLFFHLHNGKSQMPTAFVDVVTSTGNDIVLYTLLRRVLTSRAHQYWNLQASWTVLHCLSGLIPGLLGPFYTAFEMAHHDQQKGVLCQHVASRPHSELTLMVCIHAHPLDISD